ncbi:MAG: hypothetical protein JST29_07060 [Bacteroidetes bacterium]|nr:hypothetical protein [Bacteroidota bacterium]
MKRIFTLLLLFPLCYIVNAQPTFNYALALAPGADNINTTGYSVARDGQGNIYVCGTFNNTVNFNPSGSASLTANGTSDAFIAKYNSSGVYQWAFNVGASIGGNNDAGRGIVIDNNGSVLISGTIGNTAGGTVNFDPNGTHTVSFATAGQAIFIAKYDSSGNYLWAVKTINTGSSTPFAFNYDLACDKGNNIVITGNFTQTCQFDPSGSNSSGSKTVSYSTDGYIAKYNPDGTLQWVFSLPGYWCQPTSICYNTNNNTILLTGIYETYTGHTSITFDPTSSSYNLSGSTNGANYMFIASYKNGKIWTGGSGSWSTASNWSPSGVPSLYDNTIISSGSPTVSGTASVSSLTISGSSTLTIPSSATLQIGGNLNTTSNSITSTAGTVYLSGWTSSPRTIPASTFANNTIQNLTIDNNANVTLGGPLTVTGTITPSSGTLTTNGNLILASSSNANASIAQGSNTGNYISGNVTVQRYIGSSAQWRMIGFPFTSATTISQATLSGFFSSGYNAYTYNEANDDKTHYGNSGTANAGWTQFTSGTTSSKNGILLKGGTPNSTISFTGPINAGNSSAIISLTKTQNGWNFIANPFPSNINWTSILSNNSSVLNNAIYRYDPNSTAYASYVGGSSTGNQTNVIENGAGFFVQAKTAGSIAIQESDKTTSTAVSLMGNEPAIGTLNPNGSAAPTNTNSIIKLSLAKQGDKYADEVVLRWGVAPDATDKFDGKYDAYDMGRNTGPDLSVIGNDSTVYSIFHGSELKNNSDENRTVQLGIKNMEEGNYTIGIQLLSLIAGNNKAYLYDGYTGVYTLIDGNTNSYGFITTSDMQSQKSTRFSIVLNAKATEADNNNLPVVLLNNPSNNNQFTLFSKSNYNQLQYQVIDNAGGVLNAGMFNNVLKGSVYNINAANAVQGHYFIKLIGNGSLLPTLNAVKN